MRHFAAKGDLDPKLLKEWLSTPSEGEQSFYDEFEKQSKSAKNKYLMRGNPEDVLQRLLEKYVKVSKDFDPALKQPGDTMRTSFARLLRVSIANELRDMRAEHYQLKNQNESQFETDDDSRESAESQVADTGEGPDVDWHLDRDKLLRTVDPKYVDAVKYLLQAFEDDVPSMEIRETLRTKYNVSYQTILEKLRSNKEFAQFLGH